MRNVTGIGIIAAATALTAAGCGNIESVEETSTTVDQVATEQPDIPTGNITTGETINIPGAYSFTMNMINTMDQCASDGITRTANDGTKFLRIDYTIDADPNMQDLLTNTLANITIITDTHGAGNPDISYYCGDPSGLFGIEAGEHTETSTVFTVPNNAATLRITPDAADGANITWDYNIPS